MASDGALLVAEGERVYQIRPGDFQVMAQIGLEGPLTQAGLAIDPTSGRAVGIGPGGVFTFSASRPE
jgi:hypothetical protein